jgi:hypothetical protein
VEYREKDFYRAAGREGQKLPFYMTYPMQNLFLEEAEYERDLDRMKGMYPREVRRILECVEEECDKLEYEGSMMFDEYPDQLMMRRICQRIYRAVADNVDYEAEQYEAVETEELRLVEGGWQPQGPQPGFPGNGPAGPAPGLPKSPPPAPDNGLMNLIQVMLYNEMYQRRCRHRRCRRWW